jgi:hypothetical protein
MISPGVVAAIRVVGVCGEPLWCNALNVECEKVHVLLFTNY